MSSLLFFHKIHCGIMSIDRSKYPVSENKIYQVITHNSESITGPKSEYTRPQSFRYHKIRKNFLNYTTDVKYYIGLKKSSATRHIRTYILWYLVYKFKRIVGKPNFSDQFKKIIKRYIKIGYNLDVMRQSACLVSNPITVYSYDFLFNCTTVGQASDSMMALT